MHAHAKFEKLPSPIFNWRCLPDSNDLPPLNPDPPPSPRLAPAWVALGSAWLGLLTLIGSAIVLVLRNWVSGFLHYYTALMGVVFIATVLWAPNGLMGLFGRRRKSDDAP